ncbi:LytTR family DNA-binding domain-containing protein [Brevundimonas sp. FT23042]|uniref:LytTR family DNA-binding domain-containing protein n=1 Tax=Brevundimonas sp. FT23042 TaxID=3393749 RepID=UPI003B587969
MKRTGRPAQTLILTIDRSLIRGLLIAEGAAVVLALTGAFGMDRAPLWLRLIYWCPMMLVGALWGVLASRLVEKHIDLDRQPWLMSAALTALISGPTAVSVWVVTGLVFNSDRALHLSNLSNYLAPVAIVTGTLSLLNVFLARTPVQTHAASADAPPARFPDRLPPRLRGAAIRAVESEDHYLRVHTDRGSDLILMRLSDALIELEGLEGAQTHRSWWVARDAVREVVRGEGRATFTLEGGIEAPVSRRYARALRDAGWY